MTRLVADTSALVSVACADLSDPSALDLLVEGFSVVVPQVVADELSTLASYEHDHRKAAQEAEAALTTADVISHADISDSIPPLDAGERAAIALANDKHATYLLCDEFTNLTLIASALDGADLLTTPALLTAFVETGVLTKADAQTQLAAIATMRSWEGNAYYQRARRVLDQL